ncbi:metallophosphoesterase family protein [Gorillibacterium sp. sgz5001074]|uniref:metallophosphoesterase family protein n=1 Tax=Gorillibacterium sp. sgz5001074 TaxID=3446695 RepID=UPI003F666E99
MEGFRFIHAADLHLDSPFAGLSGVPDGVRAVLRESTFTALNRLVELAVREKADFVLIAGDVYESAGRSLRAQVRFGQAMKRLAESGISAFVVHGNHDPMDGRAAKLELPRTVHVFPAGRAERAPVLLPGRGHVADVWGISYPTAAVRENYASLLGRRDEPQEAPYRIGLLHANVDGAADHADYAPCTLRELTAAGMDYWALGHVHTRRVLHESPYVVYPGNLQGRSVRETGAKGCYMAEVDEGGGTALTFHPLDGVRWMRKAVSIAGLTTEQELKDRLELALEETRSAAEGRPSVLRLELTGRGPLHRALRRGLGAELLEELRLGETERGGLGDADSAQGEGIDFVWPEALRIHTAPEANWASAAASEGLLGDVLRLAESLRSNPEELGRFAARCLEPLSVHPKAGALLRRSGLMGTEGPDPEEAAEWLRQASDWLLDRLVDESGEES